MTLGIENSPIYLFEQPLSTYLPSKDIQKNTPRNHFLLIWLVLNPHLVAHLLITKHSPVIQIHPNPPSSFWEVLRSFFSPSPKARIQVPPHLLQEVLFSSWVNISQPQQNSLRRIFFSGSKQKKRIGEASTWKNINVTYSG